MPNASDIGDSIEPGSLPYGERQIVEENIQQAASQRAPAPVPGQASGLTSDRLASGPVSDLPITDGLSLGPGSGPATSGSIAAGQSPAQLRLIAQNARNPLLRKNARDALRATLNRSA
jgi:hypothetical protein